MKRALGDASTAADVYEVEVAIYQEALSAHVSKATRSRCDLLEGMAGNARCTRTAPLYGLVSLQPADYRYD